MKINNQKKKEGDQMGNHWFWNSKFMGWVEKSLLNLTDWVWHKRNADIARPPVPTIAPAPVEVVQSNPPAKKAPAKRPPAKKTTKKTEWNAKL
jgi:hypothetical protein